VNTAQSGGFCAAKCVAVCASREVTKGVLPAKEHNSTRIATLHFEEQSSFADYKKFHEKIATGTSKLSRGKCAMQRNIFGGGFV